MSYNVFPTFAGRGWGIKKRPITRTLIQQADSGAEYRTQRYQYPLYEFDIEIPYLTQADSDTLIGFYNQQGGPFQPFWFSADNDNSVTNDRFATGDGITTQFQLTRTSGGFTEPVLGGALNPQISVGGVLTSAWSSSLTNLITFTTAPASGAAITWSGGYLYLVRFKDDQIETTQTLSQIYEATTLTLRSVR